MVKSNSPVRVTTKLNKDMIPKRITGQREKKNCPGMLKSQEVEYYDDPARREKCPRKPEICFLIKDGWPNNGN